MIEWFDDLTLGMRFKSGEVSVSKEDTKRFAADFDPLSLSETESRWQLISNRAMLLPYARDV